MKYFACAMLWVCILGLLSVAPADITGLEGRDRTRAWVCLGVTYALFALAMLLEAFG